MPLMAPWRRQLWPRLGGRSVATGCQSRTLPRDYPPLSTVQVVRKSAHRGIASVGPTPRAGRDPPRAAARRPTAGRGSGPCGAPRPTSASASSGVIGLRAISVTSATFSRAVRLGMRL